MKAVNLYSIEHLINSRACKKKTYFSPELAIELMFQTAVSAFLVFPKLKQI
jgi:hypothetical protein